VPIYEYQCEHCGVFEEMQRITDPALTKCPKCRRKVRRLISNTSFQLKGTGWYVTDYARSGGGKDADKASDAKPASSADAKDAKPDAKPATKSDTKTETKASATGASTTS
jgi:putative FmdB family regulatory protein